LRTFLDVKDRKADYEKICKEIQRLELGLRAVSVMYDDHSSDMFSKTNIFRLKDNIYYRLISVQHQYKLLLEEQYRSEKYLEELVIGNPKALDGFYGENPYFEMLEMNISSIFDGLIFHTVSIIDFFSHVVCYICQKNKSIEMYWSQLAKSSRGEKNEISKLQIAKVIDSVDRDFVCRLYDYRSRLVHHKRDRHLFTVNRGAQPGIFEVRIFSSPEAVKHFQLIKQDHKETEEFTLLFLSSWLISTSIKQISLILEALVFEIKSASNFDENMKKGKGKKWFPIGTFDPKSRSITLTSDILWEQFKRD